MTDEEPEKVLVRLSDGTWADDLIEPRPLWVFDEYFSEKEIFTGDKSGLLKAAAELVALRNKTGNQNG